MSGGRPGKPVRPVGWHGTVEADDGEGCQRRSQIEEASSMRCRVDLKRARLSAVMVAIVVAVAACGPQAPTSAAQHAQPATGVTPRAVPAGSVRPGKHPKEHQPDAHQADAHRAKQPRPKPQRAEEHGAKAKTTTASLRKGRVHLAGVPMVDVPNRALTPGAVLTTSRRRVCTPGYAASVRDVPDSEKDAVYARYHVTHVPYTHEVDHLVSLELGGSNTISNLWPEPYAGRWGAHTKDAVENRLHALVCTGQLSLVRAQQIEATNWVAAYRRYLGTPPVATASTPTARPTVHAGRIERGCEPGYSPCLPRVADLNCSDIPASKTPVRVTGSDPYRLDANHDGWGCTS
jgi:hypothetical protein